SAASIFCDPVPILGIDSLGLEPFVFVFRKRAAPAVGEIKDRYVKNEHGVVPACAWSKDVAQLTSEIVFTWFGFHLIFVCFKRYRAARPVTTKQSWDLWVPLSREDIRVAESADGR